MITSVKLPSLCRYCRRYFVTSKIKNASKRVAHQDLTNTDNYMPRKMRQYFYARNFSDEFLAKIPEYFSKAIPVADNFLLYDCETAKLLAYTICSRLKGEYVLQFEPGLGLMSEILVTVAPNLWMFERNAQLQKLLHEKFRDHLGKKVKIVNTSFKQLCGILSSENEFSEQLNEIFAEIPRKPWTEDVAVSFILTAFNNRVITFLVNRLVTDERLKQFGRLELFMLVEESVLQRLTSRPDNQYARYYNSRSVLFHMFFEIDILLDKISRKVFLPWPSYAADQKDVFLILVTPKVNMFKDRNNNFLEMLLVFVNSFLHPRKRVIAALEQLVPHCGPQFILEEELTTYTEFLELPPEKILSLVEKLIEFPEFDQKIFLREDKTVDIDFGDEIVYKSE